MCTPPSVQFITALDIKPVQPTAERPFTAGIHVLLWQDNSPIAPPSVGFTETLVTDDHETTILQLRSSVLLTEGGIKALMWDRLLPLCEQHNTTHLLLYAIDKRALHNWECQLEKLIMAHSEAFRGITTAWSTGTVEFPVAKEFF